MRVNARKEGLDDNDRDGQTLHVAGLLRPRYSYLFVSCLLSAVIHLSAVITLTLFVPYEAQADIEVTWLAQFDNLEGLGHGGSGRWAELDPTKSATAKSTEPPPLKPESTTVAPAPKTKEKKVQKKARPRPDTPPKKAPPKKRVQPQDEEPESESAAEIPALDRKGPNQLPAMESYGPGNMIMSALLRLDRLRSAPFELEVRKLLELIPDFRITLAHTGIDPVDDLDSIFMASARPEVIQHSFVAVRHSLTDVTLQKMLDRRYPEPPPWTDTDDFKIRQLVPQNSPYKDSRKIVLDGKGLGMIVRPEWLSLLAKPIEDDTVEPEKLPTLIEGLRRIEEIADADDTLLLVSAQAFRTSLPVIGRISLRSLRMALRNPKAPELTIDLGFETEQLAETFSKNCPAFKRRLLRKVPLFLRGIVSQAIGPLSCQNEGHFVEIGGVYSAKTVRNLLGLAGPLLPNPPILAQLPGKPMTNHTERPHRTRVPALSRQSRESEAAPPPQGRIKESAE
jgi:hypothetical protein